MLASLACRSISTISRIVDWSGESMEVRGCTATCWPAKAGSAASRIDDNNNTAHLLITMRPPRFARGQRSADRATQPWMLEFRGKVSYCKDSPSLRAPACHKLLECAG